MDYAVHLYKQDSRETEPVVDATFRLRNDTPRETLCGTSDERRNPGEEAETEPACGKDGKQPKRANDIEGDRKPLNEAGGTLGKR